MRILKRSETWIHTHFLTNGQSLTPAQQRLIKTEMESFLRAEGIVFGIHLEEAGSEEGLKIVLECIPLPTVRERIQAHLERLVRDIPARKPTLKRVRFE